MSARSEGFKLAQLRAKTDRDLALLINSALDLGLLLADHERDTDPASVLHHRAAHIYADTVMLLEKLEDLRERQCLDKKLMLLRSALDRRVQVQTAGVTAI